MNKDINVTVYPSLESSVVCHGRADKSGKKSGVSDQQVVGSSPRLNLNTCVLKEDILKPF